MHFQIIINITISAFIYLLLANSFSIIYYATKFFHIAHAGIIAFGAYSVFLFENVFFISFTGSIILAILSATLIGILCEVLFYRHLRKHNVPAFGYLIASIGLYVVLQNCISLYFGDDTKIINTSDVTVGNQIFGAFITTTQIVTILISSVLLVLVDLFMKYTSTGKSIRAVSSNPELCDIYGMSSNKIILIAFGIGSALAATAGILSAMDTNMTPTFGFNLLLYGIVVMIIGGIGSTRGLIVGAFFIATAQHLSAYYIDTKWMDAVTYIILILFLIWKPLGISGKRLKKMEV